MENLRAFQHEEPHCPQLTPSVVLSGHVGRPKFDVTECQLTVLVESGLQIVSIVGASLSTVRRRIAESVSSQYSQLSDESLDRLIITIKEVFPTCGNKQMLSHLQAHGHRIQQTIVRESLMRVDSVGSMMQGLKTLNRRQYCVPAPRSL